MVAASEPRTYSSAGAWGADAFTVGVREGMVYVREDIWDDIIAETDYRRAEENPDRE